MEVHSTAEDVENTSQSNSPSNSASNRSTSQRHQRAMMSGMALLLQQMRSTANETKTSVTKENIAVEKAPEKPKRILPPKSKVEYSQLSSECRGDLQLTASQVVSECFHENTTPKFGFHPKCPENNYVRSCKFSPKGDFLVCDSEDRMLRIFGVMDNKLEFCKSFRQGGLIYNLTWDPFGDWIATTSGGDTPIQFWSVDGELHASYLGINHLDQIESAYSMAFNQNGERLYAGYKGMIRRFEIERPGKQISQLSTYVKGQASQGTILSCITTSPSMDGVFAVGSYGSGIGLYSDYTNSCDMLIPCDTRFVTCIQYSADGQKIFIGGRKTNAIECFDIRSTAKLYAKYERKTNTNQRYGFQIDSADRFLFTGDSNGQLLVFDLLSTSPEAEWRVPNVTSSVVSDVSLHPTIPLIATAHGQRVFPQPLASDSDEENNETVKEMNYVEMGKKFDNSLKLWCF
ncbi:hypothetical protein M3Y98_01138000 [Aphelenchoides besseyi]|nr:hypothetical protein M3Y98_01138000 [Aphelenchoides besseyi]KAI6210656.1 hypothetical protein M3Y96_00351000 [Aphelenchoides besseyi]